MNEDTLKVGFALTGSYCTFSKVVPEVEKLVSMGIEVVPIVSENVSKTDTRFGKAQDWLDKLQEIAGNEVIKTIRDSEPIGPKNLIDALIVAPCTGNSIGKIANGITDTSVTMAAKANLRNNNPLIIAVSTNDGLTNSAKNIGMLLNMKNVFLVPFGQDDPVKKTASLVADFTKIYDTLFEAIKNRRQVQPVIIGQK